MPIRDMYDALPEWRGTHLRRQNKERLAALDAETDERQERLARVTDFTPACPIVQNRDSAWRPRLDVRGQRQRSDGRRVWSMGARLGYWPCLQAPFIRVDVGPFIIEACVGRRGYRHQG